MKVTMEQLKQFRAETGFKLGDCKEALEKTNGDFKAAKEYIVNKWKEKTADWNN